MKVIRYSKAFKMQCVPSGKRRKPTAFRHFLRA
jgi:hypothetical protein